MMKQLLAPRLLTLCLKYFLLMLLWQRCPRTTHLPGSLLEELMPVQHMFGGILGGGMHYITFLALTGTGQSSKMIPNKQQDKRINIILCPVCPQRLSRSKLLENGKPWRMWGCVLEFWSFKKSKTTAKLNMQLHTTVPDWHMFVIPACEIFTTCNTNAH